MGGGWGTKSDRERRDRVREIKEILRQKKKSRESREKRNQPASWLGDYRVEKRDMSNVSLECFMPVFQKDSVALTPLHSCTLIK